MAEFLEAYNAVLAAEGGLADHPADKGGQTYAGIARKFFPQWEGWQHVDRGQLVPVDLVRSFYLKQFWEPLRLDPVIDQRVANAIFSYAVNAGISPAVQMAQRVVAVLHRMTKAEEFTG